MEDIMTCSLLENVKSIHYCTSRRTTGWQLLPEYVPGPVMVSVLDGLYTTAAMVPLGLGNALVQIANKSVRPCNDRRGWPPLGFG